MNEAAQNPEQHEDPSEPSSVEEAMASGMEDLAQSQDDGDHTPEQLKAVIEALQVELNSTKDQMMRVAADAENTKRRAMKERDDGRKYATTSFARDLLSVADNLRRALEAVPEDLLDAEPRVKNLIEGIEATEKEMLRTFESNGIKKIIPDGELFNPNYHEVMFEASNPAAPAGTIVQVMEPGYVLYDRLLRPARVGVVKDEGQNVGHTEPGAPSSGVTIDTEA